MGGKKTKTKKPVRPGELPVTGVPHSCAHPAPAAGSWPRPHTAAQTALRDDTPGRTLQGPTEALCDKYKCCNYMMMASHTQENYSLLFRKGRHGGFQKLTLNSKGFSN